MRVLYSVFLACLVVCAAQAQKPRVLLAPVEVLDSKGLPDMDKKDAMAAIAQTVEVYVAQQLHKAGAEMVKAVQADQQSKFLKEGLKGDSREILATLEAAGDDASVDYVVVVQVGRWSQRDKSVSEVLAVPGGAASETKVEVRLWLFSKKDRAVFSDGSRLLTGTWAGSRIGTQTRGELSGNPADVAQAINLTNRKRMTFIGQAVWEAVKGPIKQAEIVKLP